MSKEPGVTVSGHLEILFNRRPVRPLVFYSGGVLLTLVSAAALTSVEGRCWGAFLFLAAFMIVVTGLERLAVRRPRRVLGSFLVALSLGAALMLWSTRVGVDAWFETFGPWHWLADMAVVFVLGLMLMHGVYLVIQPQQKDHYE